jgi:hypothetical protein
VTRFCLQRYLHSIDDKDSEPITNSLRPFIDGILHVSHSPLSIVITLSSRRLQDFQKHSLGYFRFVRVLFCPHHVIWKKPVKERKTRVSRLYLVMVKPALDRVPSRKLENVVEGRRLFISIVSDTFRYLFSIGTLIASLTVFVYIFFSKKICDSFEKLLAEVVAKHSSVPHFRSRTGNYLNVITFLTSVTFRIDRYRISKVVPSSSSRNEIFRDFFPRMPARSH